MPILECIGLQKNYGSTHALGPIDMGLEPGHIVGPLGPNGSGKTTLIKLATGLLQPTSGIIAVCGERPGAKTAGDVAYLPERIALSDWMSVRGVIDFYKDFYKDFDAEAANTMASQLGLAPKQTIKQMSKGMREKLQLLLTMARRAKLYLLDEPIGGVDPATRDYILHTILSNFNPEACVVISTHLIADVEQILDDAVFLSKGQILLAGNCDELRQAHGKSIDGIFREVFKCWEN